MPSAEVGRRGLTRGPLGAAYYVEVRDVGAFKHVEKISTTEIHCASAGVKKQHNSLRKHKVRCTCHLFRRSRSAVLLAAP